MNIIEFYKKFYKDKLEDMNKLLLIQKLVNKTKNNVSIKKSRDNSEMHIYYNILYKKPHISYDVYTHQINFSFSVKDNYSDGIEKIISKYFNMTLKEFIDIMNKKQWTKYDFDSQVNFLNDLVDYMYMCELGDN